MNILLKKIDQKLFIEEELKNQRRIKNFNTIFFLILTILK